MNKYTPYARKGRQLKYLSRQISSLLDNGRYRTLPTSQWEELLRKLRRLYLKAREFFTDVYLRKALGGAALLLGLSQALPAQTFGPAVVAPFNFQNAFTFTLPTFADIDNDGDLDLVAAGSVDNALKIYLFENIGTPESPDFAAPVMSPFGINDYLILTPAFADIDGDGDQDLIIGSFDFNNEAGNFIFRRNTGTPENPAFGPSQVNPFGLTPTYYVSFPCFADIDNDSDFDLFASEYYGTILYFENTGTIQSPSFAAPVANPFGIVPSPPWAYFRTFDFADVDNDGDLDMLFHLYDYSEGTSRVRYQENTGTPESPSFNSPVAGPFGILIDGLHMVQPAFADIDNDGDSDLFIGGYSEAGGLLFFENLLIQSGVKENTLQAEISISPNPATGIFHLKAVFPAPPGEIEILATDPLGRTQRYWREKGVQERFETRINLSGLAPGLYFVQLKAEGRFTTMRILLE